MENNIKKSIEYIQNKGYMVHHGYGSDNDWEMIWIMGHNGGSFCRVYWYHDDMETICLDNLGVNSEIQNKGIGTELQIIREEIGKMLGCKKSVLWVKKNTWQQKWYERRGYEYLSDHKSQNDSIWMKKLL